MCRPVSSCSCHISMVVSASARPVGALAVPEHLSEAGYCWPGLESTTMGLGCDLHTQGTSKMALGRPGLTVLTTSCTFCLRSPPQTNCMTDMPHLLVPLQAHIPGLVLLCADWRCSSCYTDPICSRHTHSVPQCTAKPAIRAVLSFSVPGTRRQSMAATAVPGGHWTARSSRGDKGSAATQSGRCHRHSSVH